MLTNESAESQFVHGYNLQLVAANHKSLTQSIALVRADNVYLVPVEDLRVKEGFNPRFDRPDLQEHIRSIADSIRENGFFSDKALAGYGALEGKKPVIYITEGGCRLAAVRLAIQEGVPLDAIPVAIKDKQTSMEDLTVALVRGNQGKEFTPPELALICKRLADFNWKPVLIATKLGFTVEYVNQLLTFCGAPKAIRDMVQSGQSTVAVALEAIRQYGGDASGVMDKALEAANASGKTKLTRKHMPAQIRKKAVVKFAPRMLTAIEQVMAHKTYAQLPADLRELIAEIVSGVPPEEVVGDGATETQGQLPL